MHFGTANFHEIFFSCISLSSLLFLATCVLQNVEGYTKYDEKDIVIQCLFYLFCIFFTSFITCYNLIVLFRIRMYPFKSSCVIFCIMFEPSVGV